MASVGWIRRGRGLSAFAAAALVFMVLVILWGAVVRATGSGAGCGNHWPLCNGDFVPRHPRLATVIEFTHRSMSGVCTGLVVALLAWTFQARPKGDRARKAAVFSMLLLVTEAFLGAVLVKGGYVEGNTSDMRVFMQCVHFTNTMLLLAALSLTWWWLRSPNEARQGRETDRLLTWASLGVTLVVGATGSVAALADTLFPSPSLRLALSEDFSRTAPLLVRMRWMHPAAVALEAVFVVTLCWRMRSRTGYAVGVLLLSQLVLGPLDVLLLAPVWLQVLHLLGADLFWIALVVGGSEVLSSARATASAPHRLAHARGVTV